MSVSVAPPTVVSNSPPPRRPRGGPPRREPHEGGVAQQPSKRLSGPRYRSRRTARAWHAVQIDDLHPEQQHAPAGHGGPRRAWRRPRPGGGSRRRAAAGPTRRSRARWRGSGSRPGQRGRFQTYRCPPGQLARSRRATFPVASSSDPSDTVTSMCSGTNAVASMTERRARSKSRPVASRHRDRQHGRCWWRPSSATGWRSPLR